MEFKFGAPSSSSDKSKEATASTPASGGLFGAAGNNTTQFSFAKLNEQPAASDATPPGKSSSIFGSQPQQQTGSLFGPSTSTPGAGGIFGASKPTAPSSSCTLSEAKPDATTQTSSSPALFGSTDEATPRSTDLFGSSSTTGKKSFFGNAGGDSNTGSGLFGSSSNKASSQDTAKTSAAPATGLFASTGNSLFTKKNESVTGSQLTSTPPKPLFSLASITPAGAPPMDTSTPAGDGKPRTIATSTGLFGGGQAGGKVVPQNSSSSMTTTPLFGNQSDTSTAAGPATANPSGGLFGNAASGTTSTSAISKATTASTGGLFGSKPAASAGSTAGGFFGANKPPAGTTTSKPASSIFGGPANSSTPQPASIAAAPATSGLFSGAKSASEDVKQGTDGQAAKAATQSVPENALGASTSGPTSQLPRLKNKTMEDIVTRWASDLSKYQKEFKEQATVVSQWDRSLVENGEKIQKLYLDTFEAERASHEIERQLVAVESQQDELEAWLDRYESEVQDMFVKQIGPGEQLSVPDQERERTYKLAEKLMQQLDEKSRDLSKMVKEINDISGTLSKGTKTENPLSQIVRVLNGHLKQLQWIDAHAAALQAKVAAAQKSSGTLNGHYAGLDNDAAERFYRSYMGRR